MKFSWSRIINKADSRRTRKLIFIVGFCMGVFFAGCGTPADSEGESSIAPSASNQLETDSNGQVHANFQHGDPE